MEKTNLTPPRFCQSPCLVLPWVEAEGPAWSRASVGEDTAQSPLLTTVHSGLCLLLCFPHSPYTVGEGRPQAGGFQLHLGLSWEHMCYAGEGPE